MTYSIVYSTRTGNTEVLAKTVKAAIDESKIIYFGEPTPEALKADVIFVGFWTDKGMADQKTLDFLQTIKTKQIFLFGSCGFGKSKEYFQKIIARTEAKIDPSCLIVGRFMCQGRMPQSVRDRYERMKQEEVKGLDVNLLIENFDQALSHPDVDDLKNLVRTLYLAKY